MEMEQPNFTAMLKGMMDTHIGELTVFLTPVLILVCWTLVMWLWMYATRIPAMQKANINPDEARHPGSVGDRIPANIRAVADNYNHLHEQPTVFYALMFFTAITGGGSALMLKLAFAYVGLRILHSLVQVLSSKVMLRFIVFSLSTIVLIVMAVIEAMRVFL
ncbi:MAG: MAPEG family protein [Henriciella sp.]|nr:MAPEG family protein [Henriciella sp.]